MRERARGRSRSCLRRRNADFAVEMVDLLSQCSLRAFGLPNGALSDGLRRRR